MHNMTTVIQDRHVCRFYISGNYNITHGSTYTFLWDPFCSRRRRKKCIKYKCKCVKALKYDAEKVERDRKGTAQRVDTGSAR